MDRSDRIVAVGLLCQRDLEALGAGFKRAYPVENVSGFEDLLKAIDVAEARRPGDPKPAS
jgi:hypothetical protein